MVILERWTGCTKRTAALQDAWTLNLLLHPLFFLSAAELKDDAVIDDVISLVDGGKIDFSIKIKEMLLRGSKMVDVEDYIQWAKSLVDAPVVIQQRVSTTSSKL